MLPCRLQRVLDMLELLILPTTYLLNYDPVRYVLFESCQYPTH
jgi:hypothetical protein